MYLGNVEDLGGEVASAFTNAVNTIVVQVSNFCQCCELSRFQLFGCIPTASRYAVPFPTEVVRVRCSVSDTGMRKVS